MWRYHAVVFSSWCLLLSVSHGDEKKDERFVVEGQFSVSTPGPGFVWKKQKAIDIQGMKGVVYTCHREGEYPVISLVVEERELKREAEKSATIKAGWNSTVEFLKDKSGLQDLKGEQPSLAKPIPDQVRFVMTAKTPAGEVRYCQKVLIFGKRTYHFTVLGEAEKHLDQSAPVIKSFKEAE